MKVLVAYATRHGATRDIAERVAQTLDRRGLEVTLLPTNQARSVDGFDAFVIGSAAYAGQWLGSASSFVRHHSTTLASHRTWLFSSGPLGSDTVDAKGRDVLLSTRPREFEQFERAIHPRDERVFFGAWDPSAPRIGVLEHLMPGVARRGMPSGDFRDWPAIEAWADAIADELVPQETLAPA